MSFKCRYDCADVISLPRGEFLLVVGRLGYTWPFRLCWSSQELKDLEQLVDFRIPDKEGTVVDHFSEDAPKGPYVDGCSIMTRAKQNFWGSVPERNHFVRIGADRHIECTCKTEIGQLNLARRRVDKQIMWLKVSVDDTMGMAEGKSCYLGLRLSVCLLFFRENDGQK